MAITADALLLSLCTAIYKAQATAQEDHKREIFGDSFPVELVVVRMDKVRVEIRKENVSHNEPHLHIRDSDKIDVSLSLTDFRILAGKIDGKTLKKMLPVLRPVQAGLMEIWNTLNEQDNSRGAERLINNLYGA